MTNQDEMAKKASPEQVAPVVAKGGVRQQSASDEPAPPNGLPDWSECALRVGNSDFLAKRVAEGGYGAEHDSKLASALHRFIYEYDDADSYRSAWFLHRLELVIEEVKRESILAATPTPSAGTIDSGELHALVSNWRGAAQVGPGDRIADAWRALIAHIDARMAAARQEGYEQGFIHGQEKIDVIRQKLNKAEAALAAAREQALEEAARVVESRCIGFKDDDTELREQAAAIRALKAETATHPAQEAKAQPEIQPAAGLTDMHRLAIMQAVKLAGECKETVLASHLRAILDATRITQQPAQAAAEGVRRIADELEQEAANYDGDFADTVKGCAEYLHDLLDTHPAALIATHGGKAGDVERDAWAFIEKVAKQKPEKPDYWSECGQCGRNAETADELIDQRAAMQAQQAGKAGVK